MGPSMVAMRRCGSAKALANWTLAIKMLTEAMTVAIVWTLATVKPKPMCHRAIRRKLDVLLCV